MNESSVSSPFMKDLRSILPEAVVVKHRDASFVGLPDCSVHWRGLSYWFEFKLWIPTKEWSRSFKEHAELEIPYRQIAEESPVQLQMMRRLGAAATDSWYIFFVNKTKHILLWNPVTETKIFMVTRPQLVSKVCQLIMGQGPGIRK